MAHFPVLIRLLRHRNPFLAEVLAHSKLESKIVSLLGISSVCLAAYGATMGAYSSGLQIAASAIKLPALYLITLVICLPPLYFFDILFGSKLNFKQYVTMGLMTVAIMSGLLLSFTPMMLFFLLSIEGYNFFLLLNVFVMALTGYIGVRFFYQGMRDSADLTVDFAADFAAAEERESAIIDSAITDKLNKRQLRDRLLKGWVILYGLIGSQLGWTLSPAVGVRGEPFQFFRVGTDSNFYAEVLRAALSLLGQ
jgi:hypothetical protein